MRKIYSKEATEIALKLHELVEEGKILEAARLADETCRASLPRGFWQRFFPQKRRDYLALMLASDDPNQRDLELLHLEGCRLLGSAGQMLEQDNNFGAGNFATKALPFLRLDSEEYQAAQDVIAKTKPTDAQEEEWGSGKPS